MKCKIFQSDSSTLRFTTGDAAASDLPSFVNNTSHSLFSDCSFFANGIKTSSSSGNYAQNAFIETKFSHNGEAKYTWLKCQGNSYEKSTDTFTDVLFTACQNETKPSAVVKFIGKVAADFFSCEKHLISGVTLRVSFLRNRPVFRLICDDESKDYKTGNQKQICTYVNWQFQKMFNLQLKVPPQRQLQSRDTQKWYQNFF